MSRTRRIVCIILATAVVITAVAALVIALMRKGPPPDGTVSESDIVIGGENGGNGETPPDDSLPEDDPAADNKEGWEYINPYYEKFPPTDNTSNFHSHATATYENINGSTVKVDTLYRKYKEALNDPNFACGMLIYQCIEYKRAHPSDKVDLAFTSFRVSPTIAVCLDRNSPYYGYVRSLYDEDYDANGFVRVSYLLVEAARMGINVTIVGHLNSYAVKQYNNETGETYSKDEPSYVEYFQKGMLKDCYEGYGDGKKASDFMTFRTVDWPYDDKTATDVMHVKTCTASAYRDQNGLDHRYGVWFSSTNLDAVDYKGCNGNGGSQSGVIITNHEDIYRTTVNYVSLMAQYCDRDSVFEFRKLVSDRTEKQIYAILADKQNEIPLDERIIYLGGETDEIFELYFAPLSGDIDVWDTTLNPYCKYIQAFYESDNNADVIFSFNNPNFRDNFLISHGVVEALEYKFIENKRAGNRLGMRCAGGDLASLKALKAGEDLAFINIITDWDCVHEKDILMSYVEDGVRKYTSIISSCNFNSNALFYQTNQILVIKETEETGSVVFTSLGVPATKGAITDESEGIVFSSDQRVVMDKKLKALPTTVEAVVKLDKTEETVKSYGNLFANSDYWNLSLAYEINKNGNPQAVFGTRYEKDGLEHFKTYTSAFENVNVCTSERVHLTFVINKEESTVSCYVEGALAQTVKIDAAVSLSDDRISPQPFVVGGDHLGSNYNYFRGTLYELSAWSDVRTNEEIVQDANKFKGLSDEALLAHYEFYGRTQNTLGGDMSANNNNLRTVKLWLDKSEVIPVDDGYCFAVVPDTQMLSYYYYKGLTESNGVANIYDWLLKNKDEKRIEYVIGVGDITELSVEGEYENAKEHIYKLSGNINFSLVMGNHDKYDFKDQGYMPESMTDFMFNKTFYNETYLKELDGWYGDGDVSNSYNAFEIGGTKWLLLNLDFGPTDEMLEWACGVIEQYPDHKVIVVSHAYLYRDGTTLDESECYPSSGHNPTFNNGDDIFEKLVKKYENVELVIGGHDPWDHIVCSQVKGEHGNTVTQLLIDSQYMDKYYGATEMIALLYFSPDGRTMTVRYYSVEKAMYGSELSQFTVLLD